MKTTENQWKSPKINENHRKSMKITENDRKRPKPENRRFDQKVVQKVVQTSGHWQNTKRKK